jgi:hypothetical protein
MVRAAALVVALLLLAAPATADTGTLRDPGGDVPSSAEGKGLDVKRATFDNGFERLAVTVSFTELRRGALVVSVSPRGGHGLRLVSKSRPGRPAKSYVVAGSFDDVGRGRVDCAGLRAVWRERTSTVHLTMPPRCLAHAEYGELRFAVLTEQAGGDSDYAPDHAGGIGATRWIDRG